MVTDRFRIGVVGAGGIAQVAHLPALSRLDDVEVVALCDIDVSKARELASRFGVSDVYDDIEELLKYASPDAVVICTPSHLHEIHALTALSSGVHVLCERPLALTSQGIRRLVERQELSGKVLMVGMNNRYRSDVQAVRGFLQNGELGRLRAIRAGWYMFRPSRSALGWRLKRTQAGGGVMLDLGLSLLDLAFWLSGDQKPVRVSASFSWDDEAPDIEDSGSALIVCESGMSIFVDVSWRYLGASEKFWFEIFGSEGAASISPLKVFKEMHGTPVDVSPAGALARENPFMASYRAEWASFVAAAKGQIEAPALMLQTIAQQVFEAICKSAEEGREISL